MSNRAWFGLCIVVVLAAAGKFIYQINRGGKLSDFLPAKDYTVQQLVFVGDTQERVYQLLGEPTIEFPEEDTLIQWYAGYEITLSSNVVAEVRMKPVESEEENLEREKRAQLAEDRLREAYQAAAEHEEISYNTWKEREYLRLQREREERASVEAYENRKSSEKKAAIYADAIRKSCGCLHGHFCHSCR